MLWVIETKTLNQKIAHQRSKSGERKITSKFAESAREKASRNRSHLRKFTSQTFVEQWVKSRRSNGKQNQQ
jgi:hypothetical protein